MSKNPAVVYDSGWSDIQRGHGGILEQVRHTTISFKDEDDTRPKLTRQGVRDLNGPRMDGRGHNGHASSCSHANTLPFDEIRMVGVFDETGTPLGQSAKMVRVTRCAFCNVELSNSKEG